MLKCAKVRVYGTLVHIQYVHANYICGAKPLGSQWSSLVRPYVCAFICLCVASVWMFEDQLTASLQEWDKYGIVQQLS